MNACGRYHWLIVVVVVAVACPVRAQQPIAGTWEIEVHGGGAAANNPGDGTATLPASGPSFTSVVGTPSRQTSSWYVGDGAALVNQVNAALGATASITPLDGTVQRLLLDARPSSQVGLRLSRGISSRLRAEFSFDYEAGGMQLSDASLAGIEATRASFVSAWNAVIATGPFQKPTVTSVSAIHNRRLNQTFTTGVLTINLRRTRSLIPYATAGAGFIAMAGEGPSVSLTGHYQFQPLGLYSINETDGVTIRSTIGNAWAGVLGGGVKYDVARRWGVRVDLRTYTARRVVTTTIDATPAIVTATSAAPSGATASFTNPSIQFSNNSAVASSSLSGPGLTGFRTFSGSGLQTHVNLVAGVFWRF